MVKWTTERGWPVSTFDAREQLDDENEHDRVNRLPLLVILLRGVLSMDWLYRPNIMDLLHLKDPRAECTPYGRLSGKNVVGINPSAQETHYNIHVEWTSKPRGILASQISLLFWSSLKLFLSQMKSVYAGSPTSSFKGVFL